MATADAQNRVYLFRLQVLIIDGGLLVLRNLLDHKLNVQNITLSTCLTQEKPTITRLRRNNTITQVQYDLLYPPPGGQHPTIADFDITLTICLLRNLKCCGLKRNFNWNAIPNATDLSVEADIHRLKQHRNQISHISTTTVIKLNDFNHKWTEIEQVLNRLNASVPNPVQNLQQTILGLKNNPLDPETEERVEKEIEKWEEFEKELGTKVEKVQKDMIKLKDDMGDMKNDVEELKQFKNIKGEAKRTPSIFRRLQEKINMPKLKKDILVSKVPCMYCSKNI